MLEPPITTDDERPSQKAFTATITELVQADKRTEVVDYVLTGIGMRSAIIDQTTTCSRRY